MNGGSCMAKKKTSTKNDGKGKRYTKDELLQIMNDHLVQQQKLALDLKNKAEEALTWDEKEKDKAKARNLRLSAYNAQVDAVSRSAGILIKIFNSTLGTEDGEEDEEELVD